MFVLKGDMATTSGFCSPNIPDISFHDSAVAVAVRAIMFTFLGKRLRISPTHYIHINFWVKGYEFLQYVKAMFGKFHLCK